MDEEGMDMPWSDEPEDVSFPEPIQEMRDCKLEIVAAEPMVWAYKDGVPEGTGNAERATKAMKLTLMIRDTDIKTEHETGKPKLNLDALVNLEKHPYADKETGEVKWMGKQSLHQLEEALGFDPMFQDGSGAPIEPFVTRAGNKVAPKVDGVKRLLNPSFVSAYFDAEGNPSLEWSGKEIFADVGIKKSSEYGDKNIIKRFKKPPVAV